MSNNLLKNLVDGPITPQMIVYVTQKATSVIPCDSMLSPLSSPTSSISNSNHTSNKSNNKNNNNKNNNKNLNQLSSASSLSINTDKNHHIHHDEDLQLLPPLQNFIQRLVTRSSVSTATFLTTIVYLDRLKKKLPKLARGMHCTRHRVFLAILIVASKYLNDSSPRNKYWARFSSVYSVNKVNLMERQLLTLLDYDLRVTQAELLLHLSPFLKSPSLSTSYNNNSTSNMLIDTLKLPYPISSNLNNNNNGNLDNHDNHTINNSNEYIQRTCSYPQISKSLSLSIHDNDNNLNTISNNNNVFSSSPSSCQPLIIDNNNYYYNDDNDDAMNTDEDDEYSSNIDNTNNINTIINDNNNNSFSNFSQNIDQHQTKDQFGRRLSSTSSCSSSSTSSITTPTSVPAAFQSSSNNSNNLLLQQQLNHLQLLQLQLNLFNKQPDIPSIPSIITPTSTDYLQSQHPLNQNSHSHHHYQQQCSFQPPPLKSLLSDAGADNYFGSSDFNNNTHYNYNLPILNINHNNNNNFHQHYNHIILPNPVNTTITTSSSSSNVSYME